MHPIKGCICCLINAKLFSLIKNKEVVKKRISILLLMGISLFVACESDDTPTNDLEQIPDLAQRYKAGGGTTIDALGSFSFDNPAPNLNTKNNELHLAGDAQFEAEFVAAPSPVNPGLGVQFNNTSCIKCHPSDGRAPFPMGNINEFSGFFLRTSIAGEGMHGAPNPVPGFGDQLQNHSVLGYATEVKFTVTYTDLPVEFADGTVVVLKQPHYGVKDAYINFPAEAMLSPRIGPQMFGLGLLDAIPEEDILARQDINDADKDGISGKANYVWDPETNTTRLGRFGWKANTPSVMVQAAGAYNGDMGVTNYLFPKESSYGQSNGDPNLDDDPEIENNILDEVALYCRTLAVPKPRNLEDPKVVKGYQLFEKIGCAKCHISEAQKTGTFKDIPAISNQTIYPYTDMLLHDMGENLADGRPDFLADGNEWRTRALWGIGLIYSVNGHTDFLHDGRAKSIEEAILWHGGEAENAQNEYRKLSKEDREALLLFVESI